MEKQDWGQKLVILLGPTLLVVFVFVVTEWRTESHVRKVADVCERAGMGLEIQKINFWGSVKSRCIPRADR